MKVVVVINSLRRGGAERVVCTLTREWVREHQVLIALFDASHVEFDHGGKIEDLEAPPRGRALKKLHIAVLRSIRLARLLRRERPDLIVSFMESANFPTLAASAVTRLSRRLCVSVRNDPAKIPRIKRLLIPFAYRRAARIVAPSNGVKNALQEMGLPARRLSVIPNPIARRTDLTPSRCADFPSRYILAVGRLERQKGFDRLLKAFSDVKQSGVDLVILGDGTQRAALLAMSRELGIGPRLHLPGAVSDVEVWYRYADCFVLASHYEGWPNVVVEAMAAGCPVVSFDCSYGPAEILEDGASGVLVLQDDINGLTDAIRRVLANRTLRGHLSQVGLERARAFSVEKIAPRWLSGFGDG